jgi:Kae1-associated kinase Bud32
MEFDQKIDQGAEAIIKKIYLKDIPLIKKIRISKDYRPKELDNKLRFERTKTEAKIMHHAKKAKVLVPYVLGVGQDTILIEFINGKTLNKFKKIPKKIFEQAAFYLAQLHKFNIIHGDYTFANLMLDENKNLYVIDFGLSFISHDDEDKAVDLLTMLKSLPASKARVFLNYYKNYGLEKICLLAKKIQKRARYENKN